MFLVWYAQVWLKFNHVLTIQYLQICGFSLVFNLRIWDNPSPLSTAVKEGLKSHPTLFLSATLLHRESSTQSRIVKNSPFFRLQTVTVNCRTTLTDLEVWSCKRKRVDYDNEYACVQTVSWVGERARARKSPRTRRRDTRVSYTLAHSLTRLTQKKWKSKLNWRLTKATENKRDDCFLGRAVYDFTGPTDCSMSEAQVLSFTYSNWKVFFFIFDWTLA